MAAVVQSLAPFHSFPFDDDAASVYADIRHTLEVAGSTIGPYDLQIAAICRLHRLTLVTNNTGEFSRVNGLQIEDWSLVP
jgi:tRNA(fMet)-specific endonuclease VapC